MWSLDEDKPAPKVSTSHDGAKRPKVTYRDSSGKLLDASEVPRGWLVVLGSFLMHVGGLGLLYSNGVYIVHYEEEFGINRAQSSLFSVLATSSVFGTALFSGRLADRHGVGLVTAGGGIALALTLVAASCASSMWMVYIFHGVGMGVCASLTYFGGITVISQWFRKRRGLATGIAASGSGVGSFVWAPFLEAIIQRHGWRVALRISACISAVLVCTAAVLMRRRYPVERSVPPITQLLGRRGFVLMWLATGLLNAGYNVPLVHLPAYAIRVGLSASQGALLLGIVGATSAVGRLVVGIFSDQTGPARVLLAAFVTLVAALAAWPSCRTLWSLSLFAAADGAMTGAYIATLPIACADLFGVTDLGTTLGLVVSSICISAWSALAVGFMYDHQGSYTTALYTFAAIAALSIPCLVAIPFPTPVPPSGSACKLHSGECVSACACGDTEAGVEGPQGASPAHL